MAEKQISRQQAWSLRQKRRGNCTRCGKRRFHYLWLCDACQVNTTEYMRLYRQARKRGAQAKAKMLGKE